LHHLSVEDNLGRAFSNGLSGFASVDGLLPHRGGCS
jgi:hypothetical protein